MKQRITVEQFNEITPEQQEEIWKLYNPEYSDSALLFIGQMIEFLEDNLLLIKPQEFYNRKEDHPEYGYTVVWLKDECEIRKTGLELCDVLWEAVKNNLS